MKIIKCACEFSRISGATGEDILWTCEDCGHVERGDMLGYNKLARARDDEKTEISCDYAGKKTIYRSWLDRVPPELFAECSREMPDPFGGPELLIRKMSPELLAECFRDDPELALKYAADRLPAELLDRIARENPQAALEYAWHLLPADLLDFCAGAEPAAAFEFLDDPYYRLGPQLFDACARKAPEAALEFALEQLSPELEDFCRRVAADTIFGE